MDRKRLDIVQLVERRRKWPVEAKARIMEEALAPGATIAGVADRHGVARSQVYGWLKKARAGKLPGISVSPAACTAFVPVKVEEPAASGAAASPSHNARCAPPHPVLSRSPLAMAAAMKVDEEIDPALLARLAAALDGGKR